ncbi:MAG: SpoIIE family protein phosphatase [Candidatus Riflebacteria bacterium]|nr:SpoIIE family protein phosphatase [Candidatus Riflebacteria bacterium]
MKQLDHSGGVSKIPTRLIYIFCFLIFPLYIIYSGLDHLHLVKTGVIRQNSLNTMRRNLEQIEQYSSRSQYLHLLLKKIFDDTQAAANPQEHLRHNIENLKQRYPGDFEFIVWNADGQVIQALTDRKGFNYILTRLYAVLAEVAVSMTNDRQTNIKELSLVQDNLALIRRYLGKIFLPEHLNLPYLAGKKAGPVLTDFGSSFNSVWYQIGEKISFLCFISDRMLKQHNGLMRIIEVLNRQSPDFINGYTLSPDIASPVTPLPNQYLPDLSRALAEFENLSDQVFENDRLLIVIDVAQPGVRSFSMVEKKPSVWSRQILVEQRFTVIATLLVIFHILLYFHLTYRVSFISIRWKLTGLFILANLAPLSILAFIAQDYLSNMRVSLRNELQADLLRQIRGFDMRYSQIKTDIAGKLNDYFAKINQLPESEKFSASKIEEIKDFIRPFKAVEVYLIDTRGDLTFKEHRVTKDGRKSASFIAQLGEAILKFNNGILISRSKSDIFSALLSPDNAEFIRDSYRLAGRITTVNLGNLSKISYWYIFGDRRNYRNTHILMIIWDNDRFQEHYIEQYFASAQKNPLNAQFIAQRTDAGRSWPERNTIPPAINKEFVRASGFRDSHSGSFNHAGETKIFACARGRNLDHMMLAFVCPQATIEKRVDRIRLGMVAGALISLLLTIVIGQALSTQFLKPIHLLGEGTMAIGARRFSHRIPAGDEDEFGHLGSVFNRVIEGLGELEVARIVQENLLPGNHFKAGPFTLYGKSVVMTTLGGDYYDCFAIDAKNWGVVIGDVAGHGVSAGLMMAMAKAGVLMASDEEKRDPAAMVKRLHQIFFAIKNEKLKRMMTLQYFVFNLNTGVFRFANAGHCFPVVVKPKTATAEYIEHVATPLGIGRKPKHLNYEFVIDKGESLVLYTDGIAEASNAEGEGFGYERLRDLLVTAYDADPEVYYRHIYEAYTQWIVSADDDLTLIVINRQHEHET